MLRPIKAWALAWREGCMATYNQDAPHIYMNKKNAVYAIKNYFPKDYQPELVQILIAPVETKKKGVSR